MNEFELQEIISYVKPFTLAENMLYSADGGTRLKEDLQITTFGRIKIIELIEKRLKIKVNAEDYISLLTLSDLGNLIKKYKEK